MGIIRLNNVQLYAHHGCMPEEAIIGGRYRVDVEVETDFSQAAVTDDLQHTIDYVQMSEIVHREMGTRSKLIEHAASRIALAIKSECAGASRVTVTLTKIAAPIPGQVESVSVEVVL